jgi:hypothetical protein
MIRADQRVLIFLSWFTLAATIVTELSGERVMTNLIAYCSLLAVGLGGYFGWPWFLLLASATVLAVIAILEQRQYRPRLAAIGMSDFLQTTAMASAAHALLASFAAYVVGLLVKSVFVG